MNLLDSFYKAKILLLGKENCAFKTAAAALSQSRRNRGTGAIDPHILADHQTYVFLLCSGGQITPNRY